MTRQQLRLAVAWLLRQTAYQEARAAVRAYQRQCLRARVAYQPRDPRGRFAAGEGERSW